MPDQEGGNVVPLRKDYLVFGIIGYRCFVDSTRNTNDAFAFVNHWLQFDNLAGGADSLPVT